MKKLILILIALICFSCEGSTTNLTNIPPIEYGDCELTTDEVNYIMFELSDIIKFNHNLITNEYSFNYDDPDAFDLEDMAHKSGLNEWYNDYITVKLSKEDFFELFKDTQKSKKEQWNITNNEKWLLKEVITTIEGKVNFQYYLIKNPTLIEG